MKTNSNTVVIIKHIPGVITRTVAPLASWIDLIEDPCFPIKFTACGETTKSRIAQIAGAWAPVAILSVSGSCIPLIRLNILNTASIAAEISASGSSFPDTRTYITYQI